MSAQSLTVRLTCDAARAYAGVKSAVEKRGYSVERYDDEALTVYIKTGVSAFSWGESITVTVQPSPDGGSEVELRSAPKLGTNVVDMGRGKRQLEAIAKAIAEELDSAQPQAAQPVEQPAPFVSVADEIRKLAQLRDEGILTEEEFTAKKRQLLGL